MKLRHLLLGRKTMTNLDNALKIKDITFLTKVHIVKAIVFPVVMYRCDHWTIKKAECQRIDAFELWSWRRLLRVPWTAGGSNEWKSTLTIHWKDWCWSWSSNTLATRKDPDVGKDWWQRKRTTADEMVGWHHRLKGHEFEQAPGDSGGQRSLASCSPWGCKESDTT